MFKDSRIYVAGHTGLLGSALLKRLGSEGYTNIIVRDRKELDLTTQNVVNEFFERERPEYVFLCAGMTGGIMSNRTYPAAYLHANISIQDVVFEASQRYNVKNLVFYGSSCIYPKNCPQPIKEEYLLTGPVEETSEAYAIAKISGLVACKSYNNQNKTNRFIALVPNTMYGPHDRFDLENSHVLSALIKKFSDAKKEKSNGVVLWGSGRPRREFIFADDVADASIFAVNNVHRLQNTHYNLGTGKDLSIRGLAELVANIVGYQGRIEWDGSKPDGNPQKLFDSSRFMTLGWKPAIESLEMGIKITHQWYLDHCRNNYKLPCP